jgi:rRNA maturation endonuclease Nob1
VTVRLRRGYWYWFECAACRWNGVRYRNARVCPKCGHALVRWRQAKEKEVGGRKR